ncbi:MAG: V-type ATP synthase subunit D [Firmicutes bacterium]|nr:V-type ATP synthase subunit D [Bacillota bacterium]
MAKLNVNSTRMEQRKLKARRKMAVRGHKLLKDKSDEMIRQFMNYIFENKKIREELEHELEQAQRAFSMARAAMPPKAIEEALSTPVMSYSFVPSKTTIMGLDVPEFFDIEVKNTGALPYSFLTTSSQLDYAVSTISRLLIKIIQLAATEKTCVLLAAEIEKNRRRINALEHVVIPDLHETIKYIGMKLEENERGSRVRLMKVKEMVQKEP